jgi:hypothetical protein
MKTKFFTISTYFLLLLFGLNLSAHNCYAGVTSDAMSSLCCALDIVSCCNGTPNPPAQNPDACECAVNSPFSGGSACTGGYCDGCHCVGATNPSPTPAPANTPIGTTGSGTGGAASGAMLACGFSPSTKTVSASISSMLNWSAKSPATSVKRTCIGAVPKATEEVGTLGFPLINTFDFPAGSDGEECQFEAYDSAGNNVGSCTARLAVVASNISAGCECSQSQADDDGKCNTRVCTDSCHCDAQLVIKETPSQERSDYESISQFDREDNIKGLKNLWSPERILGDDMENDPQEEVFLYFGVRNSDFDSLGTEAMTNPIRFKVFIPPNFSFLTVNIYNTASGGYNDFVVGSARLGEPPKEEIDSSKKDNPEWLTGCSLEEVTGKDCFFRNSAGITSVFGEGYRVNTQSGGWLYVTAYTPGMKIIDVSGHAETVVSQYQTWYDMETWQTNGDPIEPDSIFPTGPDCASKTCVGNSCDSESTTAENPWISGTKTAGCATGEAKASPSSITPKVEWTTETPAEEISYLTWTANNAKALEVGCTGPTLIDRGSMQLTSALWQADAAKTGAYTKTANEPDGYPAWFHVGTSGTEVCTFYPTNETDGLPGTPFSLTIQVLGNSTCGNNIVEGTEECDYTSSTGSTSYVPCPDDKTCENCQCVTPTDATRSYVCQPDDPNCAKSTCKDVKCFDGCNYRQGLKDCQGRE